MTDVELVIKIPEEIYETLKNDEWLKTGKTFVSKTLAVATAVVNGTPLPKGHGDLIDREELLKLPIDKANYPSNYVKYAQTIIEKDRNEDKYED
jgi:hypothetical protein